MRADIVVTVTRTDRRRLEAIGADRSTPLKHVWRAHIILATAEGCGTAEIMRRSGKSAREGEQLPSSMAGSRRGSSSRVSKPGTGAERITPARLFTRLG